MAGDNSPVARLQRADQGKVFPMFLLKKILTALILPPTGPILCAFLGCILVGRSRRHGMIVVLTSLSVLFMLAIPLVGNTLLGSLEHFPPISRSELSQVDAIVILGGGIYPNAPEYGGDTVSKLELERLRYGALLAKASGKPVLVSGGSVWGERAEADVMKTVLEKDFGQPVRWVENRSRDTAENARLAALLLRQSGVKRVAVVSHAWHLRRAAALFARENIDVVPAPTGYSTSSPSMIDGLLPTASALDRSRQALHEWLGILVNQIF